MQIALNSEIDTIISDIEGTTTSISFVKVKMNEYLVCKTTLVI